MNYIISFVKCFKCEKEFLLERILCGTNHTRNIRITCKECFEIEDIKRKKYKKAHPKEAREIKKWFREKTGD